MQINELSQVVSPIHALLHRVANPPMESVGIFPERLTFKYIVSKQREPKFTEMIKRLLIVEQSFDFRCPLCVFVSRSVSLAENNSLDDSEWQVQFQVNKYDLNNLEIANQVQKQAIELLTALDSFLFD